MLKSLPRAMRGDLPDCKLLSPTAFHATYDWSTYSIQIRTKPALRTAYTIHSLLLAQQFYERIRTHKLMLNLDLHTVDAAALDNTRSLLLPGTLRALDALMGRLFCCHNHSMIHNRAHELY